MIKVVDVSHHYGLKPVLRHVNLHVPRGKLLVLMGQNGVGKSTLLGIVAGLMSPAKGHVEINGQRRRSDATGELEIRKQLVFLPDQPWLPEQLTGKEWLTAVGQLYDIDADQLIDHSERLLELFQLTAQGDTPIRSYSNGQKKKIALCGALITEAPVMVLDEPFTGGLDPSAVLALRRVLKHLADRDDITIIMASQIPEIVEDIAEMIAVLSGTRLVACDDLAGLRKQTGCKGPLPEVFERLVHPETLEHIENYFNRPRA
jgi:ABC-type multidrug transport system ATPase subunit